MRLSTLLLSSLFLSASRGAVAEAIRGSGKHDTLGIRELDIAETVGRPFLYVVDIIGPTLDGCFDTDKEEMAAIILAALRTGFMHTGVEFYDISVMTVNRNLGAEENNRQLSGTYCTGGGGTCRTCPPDDDDRRELLLASEEDIASQMKEVLELAFKTYLDQYPTSCFFAPKYSIETGVELY